MVFQGNLYDAWFGFIFKFVIQDITFFEQNLVISFFNLEEGISTIRWFAITAFLILVNNLQLDP